MPGGFELTEPSLCADELGWLATLPDVECRLVFTENSARPTTYRVQEGPFTEAELCALPARDWTLLVQDVEKHLPDFRRLFAAVDAIPDWRIDDLMVSCAAPGGSVGPHRDNYDVFLCQGGGKRKWMLGDAVAAVVDAGAKELSLLQPFAALNTYVAEAGDVLYLPPGVPHWGVAEDLCLTYSIGMRAPGKAELASGAERIYGEGASKSGDDSNDDCFYTDADLQLDEAEPGRIAAAAVQRLRTQKLLSNAFSDEQMATILGSVNTGTKAWLTPEMPGRQEAASIMQRITGHYSLPVHGMARIAYYDSGDSRLFFANGHVRKLLEREIGIVRELCTSRKVCLERFSNRAELSTLLEWMVNKGVFDPAQ